jgi:ankyrin repeat protein
MSSYILLGNDISTYSVEHELQDGSANIFGDGIGSIDCDSLKFEKNSNVKVFAHGKSIDIKDFGSLLSSTTLETFANIGMNAIHTLRICASKDDSSLPPSFIALNKISNSKAMNFVLASCYGGAAINDIRVLPKWSTLITLNSPKHQLVGPLGSEILIKSKYFDYKDNPFIQFAYYIFNNPDSTQFAIKHGSDIKIFKSSIDNFISESKDKFSQKEIREWQNTKLNNFIDFCKEIKSQMNGRHSSNIKEFLKFVENKDELLDQSTLDRYQELLLINVILRGELGLMDSAENLNIVKDVMFINNITSFFWVIKENNVVVLEKFIDYGADVNSVSTIGDIEIPALHYSINEGHIESTKLLMEAGASINIKSYNNATALEFASECNNFQAVRELLKVGAISDNLESDGYILDSIGNAILFGLSILSRVINNEYFTEFVKIGEEEMLFMKDPIDYILTHNDVVSIALNAMDNLMLHENLVELHPQILETKECLSQLPGIQNGDLNILCGRSQFTDAQSDL